MVAAKSVYPEIASMGFDEAQRRLDRVVVKAGHDDCWEHTVSTATGYGRIRLPSRQRVCLHRLAWILANRADPGLLLVCHSCDNPKCANPKHLWLGTGADNAKDMVRKGRKSIPVGRFSFGLKLTREQARAILSDPRPNYIIADEYGVSRSIVGDIKMRKTWRSLDVPQPSVRCVQARLQQARSNNPESLHDGRSK